MIYEADAIQVLRKQLREANAARSHAITSAETAAHSVAVGALVQLARELARSSDMPGEFLRQVGVQS